jgi:hypothetical protein
MTDLTTLAQQVADLSTATTTLTTEVVGQKDRLETAADTATTKAAEAAATAATASSDLAAITGADRAAAETAATNASTSETNAAGSASAAAASAASASEVSGLDTVTAAVDLALADSFQFARTEADMEAMRAANNEQFAASGFVHFGKHHPTTATRSPINTGMWTVEESASLIELGRSSGTGDSKTEYPVMNVAGVTSKLQTLNSVNNQARIKFPSAPNGTVTYDSATGDIVDFTTDVDPKYGDVAADVNEAVARAFEGDCVNGDFRLGTTGWSQTGEPVTIDSTGAAISTSTYSYILQSGFTVGKDYTVEIEVTDYVEGDVAVSFTDGGGPILGSSNGIFKITDTVANNSSIYIKAVNGAEFKFTRISIREATNEVVTERVDVFGMEAFLRKIDTGTFVYPNGLIQSQATTMDGISTADEVARPDTFFAVFDGDTGSRGLGLDFHALSADDQAKVLANPDNNIFRMENGDIVQWCLRQRTVAGAGNGDWENLSTHLGPLAYASANSQDKRLGIQGTADTVDWTGSGGDNHYYGEYGSKPRRTGVFTAYSGEGTAINSYNGMAFFYVMGTVPRLNQGAYHPKHNSSGTATFRKISASYHPRYWYEVNATGTDTVGGPVITSRDCFGRALGTSSNGGGGSTGTLAYDGNARPDGRFYDAIYASGAGGVNDYRMSAWDASTPAKASEVFESVKNGSYRGRETLKRTKHVEINREITRTGSASGYIYLWDTNVDTLPDWFVSGYSIGGWIYTLSAESGNVVRKDKIISIYNSGTNTEKWGVKITDTSYSSSTDVGNGVYYHIAFEEDTDITVEGEFTQTDVIGDPANILQCDALKDGWLGSWVPAIETSATPIPLTRKALNLPNPVSTVRYDVIAGTYSTQTLASDSVKNTVTNHTNDRVEIINYTAFAKQTTESTNLPVLHGEQGLGSVLATQNFDGVNTSLLVETLIGKVPTEANSTYRKCLLPLQSIGLLNTGLLGTTQYAGITTHTLLNLGTTANSSPAVKLLSYQVESNDQATLNFAYNELVYNVDWGDDSTIKIVDGQSTYTNDNGDTCLYGTDQLAIPYGWVKNNI